MRNQSFHKASLRVPITGAGSAPAGFGNSFKVSAVSGFGNSFRIGAMSGFENGFKFTGVGVREDVGIGWAPVSGRHRSAYT